MELPSNYQLFADNTALFPVINDINNKCKYPSQ